MDELMPIGEFADLSGLSPKRLRAYAAAGLLVPAAVDAASGYRYYSPGQLRDAQLIDTLRRAGLPLSEITSLLRRPSPALLDDWERQVDSEATRRRRALDSARTLLHQGVESPPRTSPSERTTMVTLQSVSRTEIGHSRGHNEDVALSREDLLIVADGMGGGPGGRLAADLAVTVVDAAFTGASLEELTAGVRASNRAIAERAASDPSLEGMGTTVCAVGVNRDGELMVVNVGDSRVYLLRDGTLRQLTDDHTVVAELVRRGELGEADVPDHPHRHVLTRVLGAGPTLVVDATAIPALSGDRILLCTDGLTNEVAADDLVAALSESGTLEAVDALVDQALANGGRDNITAIAADVLV